MTGRHSWLGANVAEKRATNLIFHFERVARSWRTPLFLSSLPISIRLVRS
jgi:hypothetical protein